MSNNMPQDRLKRAIAAFVRELFPTLDYMGFYEYVVVSFDTTAQTADLQPVRDVGLPTLTKIPVRSPGINFSLPSGMAVLIGFENHDPTRPYMAFFDKFASSGFVPDFTGIAGALPTDVPPIAGGVARVGDQAGPFLITSGSLKAKSR
jgi:hypothetical protein